MVRLSLWLVVLTFDERRSERILVKSRARSDLDGVAMRTGKRVLSRVTESMTSLLRSRHRLPTILSRSSYSSTAWCCRRICCRSLANPPVRSGYRSATCETNSIRSLRSDSPVPWVEGFCRNRSRRVSYCCHWLLKSSR